MRNRSSVVLVALCAGLLGGGFRLRWANQRLRKQNQALSATIAALEQQRDGERSRSQGLMKDVKLLESRLARRPESERTRAVPVRASGTEVAGAAPLVLAAEPVPAEESQSGDKGNAFFGRFAKMMEKPEMQDAMRGQQKLMLSTLYGSLFKKLGLPPEQLDELRELLVDKQMAGMHMMGPGDQQTKAAAFQDAQKETEQAVQELLNEEQYEIYEDYQATVGERMALSLFNQQLNEKAMPLDEAQEEELITLMVEERGRLSIPPPQEQQATWAEGMSSTDVLDRALQQQEELNKRVYERSREILSEPQQAVFRTFQESQIQMQKVMKGVMEGEKKE